jgi:hypothetical protein
MAHQAVTHESFINGVRGLVLDVMPDGPERDTVREAKFVYGAGHGMGARGVTFHAAWTNGQAHAFVEICAAGEESPVQLAGTTIHELAHVVAGVGAGHGKAWKDACGRLGLLDAQAAGMVYTLESFAPTIKAGIEWIPFPDDGRPTFGGSAGVVGRRVRVSRPCSQGTGTRGGRSRGPGSGSRLRLWLCGCDVPVRVRVASDDFQATCTRCGHDFARAEAPAPAGGDPGDPGAALAALLGMLGPAETVAA